MQFRLVKVSFSYEAYVDDRFLKDEVGRFQFQEELEQRLRDLLPQIDRQYTTGLQALKIDRLTLIP